MKIKDKIIVLLSVVFVTIMSPQELDLINHTELGLLKENTRTRIIKDILSLNLLYPDTNDVEPKGNNPEFNNTELLIKSTLLGWSDSIWIYQSFDSLLYNPQNNLLEKILFTWADSIWEYYWKYKYSYYMNNNLKEELVQEWINSQWRNKWLYVYTYETNNNLSEKLIRYWISNNSSWIDVGKIIYTYDVNNNLSEELHQSWNTYNSTWENTSRWTYTYNSSNYLAVSLIEHWYDSVWVNFRRFLSFYDTNYNLTDKFQQEWEDSSWTSVFRTTYNYDENNLLSESFLYISSGGYWELISKTTFTYNQNNNITEELTEAWYGTWVNYTKKKNEYILITGVEHDQDKLESFRLSQNYPNPFNPSTKIKYSVPQTSQIQIKIFNVLGEEIETIVNEEKLVGNYEVEFNGTKLSSGIYFYKLQSGSFVVTRKMILMK